MVERVGRGAASVVKTTRRWVRRPGWTRRTNGPGRASWTRGRGRVLAGVAVCTALLLSFHRSVPNRVGGLGSLLESFLPWLGVVVVVLLVLALVRRSALALVALLLPVAAWTYLFGGLLLPAPEPGADDLVVVQHNVSDENTDPEGTARALVRAGPDLVALEELVPPALEVYAKTLAPDYPYRTVRGTVGLWSKYPLSGSRPWTSSRGASRRSGSAGCGPWRTRRGAKSPSMSRTCRRSGWGRAVSRRPGGTRAPVCWATPSMRRSCGGWFCWAISTARSTTGRCVP